MGALSLDTGSHEASATSQNPVSVSTLTVKKLFLMAILTLPWCSSVPFPCVLLLAMRSRARPLLLHPLLTFTLHNSLCVTDLWEPHIKTMPGIIRKWKLLVQKMQKGSLHFFFPRRPLFSVNSTVEAPPITGHSECAQFPRQTRAECWLALNLVLSISSVHFL